MRECFVKLVVNEDNAVVARARPSATIVVVRDASEGLEVLLLKRNPDLAHMPGAWVFPGGKVDDSDTGETIEERARVAAARELMEEGGFSYRFRDIARFFSLVDPRDRQASICNMVLSGCT